MYTGHPTPHTENAATTNNNLGSVWRADECVWLTTRDITGTCKCLYKRYIQSLYNRYIRCLYVCGHQTQQRDKESIGSSLIHIQTCTPQTIPCGSRSPQPRWELRDDTPMSLPQVTDSANRATPEPQHLSLMDHEDAKAQPSEERVPAPPQVHVAQPRGPCLEGTIWPLQDRQDPALGCHRIIEPFQL